MVAPEAMYGSPLGLTFAEMVKHPLSVVAPVRQQRLQGRDSYDDFGEYPNS